MPPSFGATSVRIHPSCDEAYARLEHQAREGRKPQASIWKSLQTAFLRAKRDAQFADPIPAKAIPRYFRDTYGATNLYCADLAGFWRCFYTIEGRTVVFLDAIDHGRYDEWFPNKGK